MTTTSDLHGPSRSATGRARVVVPLPRRCARLLAATLFLLALLGADSGAAQEGAARADAAPQGEVKAIRFEDDLDAALEAADASGRPIVVIFEAVWCTACAEFERTLKSPGVRAMSPQFHWVRVNLDADISLARYYEVNATPTTVVLAADGNQLAALEGAFGPEGYIAFLESLGDAARIGATEPVEVEHSTRLTWSPRSYRARAMCFSQIGYGPLNLPSQAPNSVLRLQLLPRTPSTLAKGEYEVVWTETAANVFAFKRDDFRLDYLTLSSNLSLAYGLSDAVQAEITVGNLLRTDSYLDSVTDAFHSLFGLSDSGRDDFPDNDNIIDMELRDGVEIEDRSSGSEATHVTLALQHNVTCGTKVWPALAYAISGRWDAGGDAELEGSSPFSAGISGSAARRLGDKFYGYLGLGYNWYGLDESRGLELVDQQWSGLFAVEWSYRSTRSLVLQYLVSEGVAVDREPFDEETHEITLGWKGEIRPGTVLEIGLIENIINVDNSADFGLHFGIRHRF